MKIESNTWIESQWMQNSQFFCLTIMITWMTSYCVSSHSLIVQFQNKYIMLGVIVT